MLTEEQIDYLLQIKASKQVISDDTVRVMLKALRWNSEEVEHGITFLNRPEAKEVPKPFVPEISDSPTAPTKSEFKPSSSIKIKQNPFPLGSPFVAGQKKHQEKHHKKIIYLGAFVGLLVFVILLIIYARFVVIK